MKKLLIGCISIICCATAHSQLYLQGGANLANITENKSGGTENNNVLATFNAGFLGRIKLYNPVELELGLLVMGEGSKAVTYFSNSTTDNYVRTRFNPVYLQLPLNAVVKIPLPKKFGVFVSAGPYVQMGIGGTSKMESSFLGVQSSSTQDVKFNNDDPSTSAQENASYDKLKRFDFGLNLGAGVDLHKVLLKIGYGFGFTKINSIDTNNHADEKNKYRTTTLAIAFRLGR